MIHYHRCEVKHRSISSSFVLVVKPCFFFFIYFNRKEKIQGPLLNVVFGACCPNPSIQIDLNAQH